jgi:hypothetical protein
MKSYQPLQSHDPQAFALEATRLLRRLALYGMDHDPSLQGLKKLTAIPTDGHDPEQTRKLKDSLNDYLNLSPVDRADTYSLLMSELSGELLGHVDFHEKRPPTTGHSPWSRNAGPGMQDTRTSVIQDVANTRDDSVHTPLTSEQIAMARASLNPATPRRFALLRKCYTEGLFHDFRIIPQLIDALNDPDEQCARFIAEKIIPGCAGRYVDAISRSIHVDGSRGDVHAFNALYLLDRHQAIRLGLELFNRIPDHFRAEVLYLIGRHEAGLGLAIDMAGSENTALRHAAIKALAHADWVQRKQWFENLFRNTPDWADLSTFWRTYPDQVIQRIIWDRLQSEWTEILDWPGTPPSESGTVRHLAGRLRESTAMVRCLNPSCFDDERTSRFMAFFDLRGRVFDRCGSDEDFSALNEFIAALVRWLYSAAEISGPTLLSDAGEPIPPDAFEDYFFACLECLRPTAFFEQFHGYLSGTTGPAMTGDNPSQKTGVIVDFFRRSLENPEFGLAEFISSRGIFWDPRWVELCLDLPDMMVAPVAFFASREHPDYGPKLWGLVNSLDRNSLEFRMALRALLRIGEPGAPGFFFKCLFELREELYEFSGPQFELGRKARAAMDSLAALLPELPPEDQLEAIKNFPDIFGEKAD